MGDAQDLIQELPKDLREKYEVQEQTFTQETKPLAKKTKTTSKKKKPFKYPNLHPKTEPILPGEAATYEMTYFGAVAGVFTMKNLPPKIMNDRKVYHFQLHAGSTSVFSLFYKIDDTVESFMDYEGLFSHRFQMNLNESKQRRNSIELYDSEKEEVFYWNRQSKLEQPFEEKKLTEKTKPFPQDLLSSIYYLRLVTIDEKHTAKFPVVSDAKTSIAEVSFVRRELLDTALGRVRTIVLTPTTTYEGKTTHKGNIHIWLTDDDRKLPVLLEAQVKIGAVRAVLKSYSPSEAISAREN